MAAAAIQHNKRLCPDTSGRCLDRQNVNRTATAIAPPQTRFPSHHLPQPRASGPPLPHSLRDQLPSPAPHCPRDYSLDRKSTYTIARSSSLLPDPTVAAAAFLAGISPLDGLLRHRLLLLAAEHPPWTLATCPNRSPPSLSVCTASSMRLAYLHTSATRESPRSVPRMHEGLD